MIAGLPFTRKDGRGASELRPITLQPHFTAYPEGSILIKQGDTHVLCNVTVEPGVPSWIRGGQDQGGWITAEYAMLPRATHQRSPRETLRPQSRSQEIRRIIGRALRAAVRLDKLPAITCTVDCDVLQADGGTRTAAITGGYVALIMALNNSLPSEMELGDVLKSQIAAVSVGWHDDIILLDLDYAEDSATKADVNVVMNNEPALIEVQGTGETSAIPRATFESMLDAAQTGLTQLFQLQADCLREQGIELTVVGM
jgi:ribonuclease PH